MHLEQNVKQSVMMNESRVDDMGCRQRQKMIFFFNSAIQTVLFSTTLLKIIQS